MLPRRYSPDPTPRRDSMPRLAAGSSGGGRPLSVAINQQTFHANTTGTVETRSPQPETSPHETPRVPLQQPPLPRRPSGVGELRQQRSGQNTYDTHDSVIEEHTPATSQPPSVTPISNPPFPQIPGHLSPTPTGLQQQPAPGSFVGGFAAESSSHYVPYHGTFYSDTADRPYQFPTMPSPQLDSDAPHSGFVDMTGGIHAKVWPAYNKISEEFDEKKLKKWNSDLDVLLIFAALFSAIVTAFLIRSLDDLGPNYQQQSALLLHQLLNGRDPSLQNISDPTLPFKPNASAIAVNCLWFISLFASLGASFGAMMCKEWLTEYNRGANPVVDLIRACQRQIRYRAFQRVHDLVALLPPLLHSSVLFFFIGAVVYLWRMDESVAIVYQVVGGILCVGYLGLTLLPYVINAPFRPYSTLFFHQVSVIIGKAVIQIVDLFVHGCYLTLRCVASAILWLLAKAIFEDGTLYHWYMWIRKILPGEYKHLRVWWEDAFDDSMEKIDTSQKVQEEAVLWLSQMPLNPSESKIVVSSLALISSTRPYKFSKSVIISLNLTLDSSLHEEPSESRTEIATDCVFALGNIKFQKVVDKNWDDDHNVGGIHVTPLVAWAAQQLTIDAFNPNFNTPDFEGTRAQLLTAAAWLSPVHVEAEGAEWEGEKLKIQDRSEFIKEIGMMLERHARGEKTLDRKIIINLIHGMHACIPRGDYGIASSTVSFLPTLCDDYDSPWSEDEGVLRALINYALDLILLPARRKPLVKREIEFAKLASELIDTLMVTTASTDVVAFGFWLIYRVPYAFSSRKTLLTDIAYIWTVTNGTIPEDHRERMNFHAVSAFIAVAQFHASTSSELPKLTSPTTLELLKAALTSDHNRFMATYAMAMMLNLGTSSQISTFTNGVPAGTFRNTLDVKSDIEKNTMEEGVLELHIYATLTLLKFRQAEMDVEGVKVLIGEVGRVIGDVRDSGVARDSKAEGITDLDRVRWKAIYLSALLFRFLPETEREEGVGGFRARVGALLQSGELPLVGDCGRCLEPLGMDVPEPRTPAEQREWADTVFEKWIGKFPLFALAGSVTSTKN